MVDFVTEDVWGELQKYRMIRNGQNPFNVADLLEDQFLKGFIQDMSLSIGAPTEKVAASIFIKRYAFLAVISLYTMSKWNKKINVALENVEMESPLNGGDWLPKFSFKELVVQDWNGMNREEWRKSVLSELFAKNIFPIIDKFEKTFKISRFILWENIAVYLFWLYESELKGIQSQHIASDYHYLFHEADGELFGPFRQNPLQKYLSVKTYLEEFQEAIRVRKTCCFSYQLQSGTRCKTCPCSQNAKDGRCHDGESVCGSVRSFTGEIQ